MKSRSLSPRAGTGVFWEVAARSGAMRSSGGARRGAEEGRIRPIVFSSSRAQEGDAATSPFGAEDCEVQTYSGVRHRWIPTVPCSGVVRVLGRSSGQAALEGEGHAVAEQEV